MKDTDFTHIHIYDKNIIINVLESHGIENGSFFFSEQFDFMFSLKYQR